MSKNTWIPEIMYEESEEGSSHIPFIMVPDSEEMPQLLYVFESRETGEIEPGLDGEEVPVVQWDLHQYADMAILKSRLTMEQYDNVRLALGLDPLLVATQAGKKITENIRSTISSD
tara:strand:+ start:2144 stop:2491 length:348 start_codon:yes stop_codon:yes gene_type:complete